MILTLFLLFLGLGLITTIIGFVFDNLLFSIVGTIIIFSMGVSLLGEPLTYKTGENTTLYYGSNLTNSWSVDGGDVPSTTDVYVFSTESISTYSSYDDSTQERYGALIMFLGVLSFILIIFKDFGGA